MSESITTCPNCGSTDYILVHIPPKNEQCGITMEVTAKCSLCKEEFKFLTWSDSGKARREAGLIW